MARLFPLTFRMAIVAMLTVIGLQATPERPLPVEPYNGSAFSADTMQVSLPIRQMATTELRALPAPTPPMPAQAAAMSVTPTIVAARPPERFYRATGPPPIARPARGEPPPRAPPALS